VKIAGQPENELVGKNLWELWPNLRGTPLAEVYRLAMEDRIPGRIHAQGTLTARWYDVSVYPSSEGITVYYVDKTEQIEAEEARALLTEQNRQQGELLEAIFDEDPGGIAVFTNADSKFQFVNRAYRAMLPIADVEPVGKTIQDVWPKSLGFHVEETYLPPRKGNERVKFDRVTRRFPDGSVRHFTVHVQPLTWHGEPATLVVVWEITELEEAKARAEEYAEKLRRSNQELQDFAFIASHDLQEPLRKVEAFGSLLTERAAGLDDKGQMYVRRMRDAAARMRAMVEGLLQLSRVNTQGRPFEEVRLAEVAAEALSDLNYQIQQSGGTVRVDTLPVVQGDPVQLRQLLQNLLSNALKYHPPDVAPRVSVSGRQDDGLAEIRIEDAGIGFEQEYAERIFQPFQRLVGRSEYEGSGIGLAICRSIVERHHGEIRAYGAVGQGATFVVRLPLLQPAAAKDAGHE
jgi:PAS domain S-box-containing protein